MKKISILKNIGLGLGIASVATPLTMISTACSSNNPITTTYISFKQFRRELSLESMKKGHFSYDDVLLGSKKFFGGNYILLIGSNAYPLIADEISSTMKFFGGPEANRSVTDWFSTYFQNSVWREEMINIKTVLFDSPEELVVDKYESFGFVTFIDNFNFKFYDKYHHEIKVAGDTSKIGAMRDAVGPFDTWGDSIENTKKLNKELYNYEWNKDDKIKASDYIRQDSQAKAFRSFIRRGLSMFPTTEKRTKSFDVAENNTAGYMIVYRDGTMQEILDLPKVATDKEKLKPDFKETSTLFGTVNKYYGVEEEKKE